MLLPTWRNEIMSLVSCFAFSYALKCVELFYSDKKKGPIRRIVAITCDVERRPRTPRHFLCLQALLLWGHGFLYAVSLAYQKRVSNIVGYRGFVWCSVLGLEPRSKLCGCIRCFMCDMCDSTCLYVVGSHPLLKLQAIPFSCSVIMKLLLWNPFCSWIIAWTLLFTLWN